MTTEVQIKNTHNPKHYWKELNILSGLAAILIIINHVSYQTIAPSQANSIFVSSFAAVIFFFVMGVGYEIESIQKKNISYWYVILNNVFILLLADLLIHWSNGR